MAVYRQIQISFWQDVFVLELTPEEKFFYLYLMTNSKTTQCGVYELPKKIIEFETGYNRETVDKLLDRFTSYGKIEYCEETKEVVLVNWLKHNSFKSPKVMACIEKEIELIKHKPFKLKIMDRLSIDYVETTDTSSQKEKEEEEEEEREKETKPTKTKYGEFQKVKLTEEEHSKLISRLGEIKTRDLIDRLDNYKESTGKTYKSDYATILNWHRREAKDESGANKSDGGTKTEGDDLAKRAGVTSL
jgi:hypothetical protein